MPNFTGALDPSIHPIHYTRQLWTDEDGLPQNGVQALIQDHHGYLWLGTQEGLARFDGVRFAVLDSRSPTSLPSNNVLSLLEDPSGAIWVGLRDGGLGKVVDRPEGLQFEALPWFTDQNVRALLLDHRQRLWVGTRGNGLWRLDDPTAGPIQIPEVASQMILALEEDAAGDLWVGTEGQGLFRLQTDGSVTHFSRDDGLTDPNVWALFEDSRGILWIGTHGGGLCRWDGHRLSSLGADDGLTSERVTSLAEDRDGNLWIGTRGGGLNRLHEGELESVFSAPGFQGDVITAILEDREGLLWLGSAGEGLIRLSNSPFEVLQAETPEASGTPRVILEDRTGTLWVGTSERGLTRVSGGRLTTSGIPAGGPGRDVFSLLEASDGSLWAGTYGAGLWRLRSGRWQSWRTAEGLPNEIVWALAEDHDGVIWIGTFGGGIARMVDDELEVVSAGDEPSNRLIRALHVAADGRLWIGTSAGVRIYDGTTFESLDEPRLASAVVYSFHEDEAGNLWIGTSGRGLWVIPPGDRPRVITTDQGLHDDLVYRILEDRAGFLWMTCNRGLFRAHRHDLLRVATGRADTVECLAFNRHDGMPATECNGGSQPAGWVGRDGRLWIPTTRGVAAMVPDRLRLDASPPPLRIERALVDAAPVALEGGIDLQPNSTNLEIRYTALSLIAPGRIQFMFRLAGLESDWTAAGGRRAAYYSRLPPGAYVFEVRASTAAGVWSPEPVRLPVVVRPHFYQTPPFYVGCAAILVLAGFGASTLRTSRLRRRERRLAQLVEERTRELLEATRRLGEANQRLEELSLQDPLTGVANRRSFDRMLEVLWAQAQRRRSALGLLMIDVDHFKAFNDHYGHPAGDRCLVMVTKILTQRLRRTSDQIARYGGEEFAVLLDSATEDTVRRLAEEIRTEVESRAIPHESAPDRNVVTISVGGAWTVPDREGSPEALTNAADQALYRAKRGGRNRVEITTPGVPG